MRTETLEWLEETHRSSGYLFLNRYGERITTRGISQQLKNYADKYGLDKKVVYPHSFRHRYAKNFLEKYNDITRGAAIESVAPLTKVLTETEFYAFAEKALAVPEVKGLLMEAVNEHNRAEQKERC